MYNQAEISRALGMSQSWVSRTFQKHKTFEGIKAACFQYRNQKRRGKVKENPADEYRKGICRVSLDEISEGSWEKENLG